MDDHVQTTPPDDVQQHTDAPTDGRRLMIKSMTLENFKSYAGEKVIGPFHKCFSSIVGPNGSGKSNVIDAMLFVFGKRSKKLRSNKVKDLIHRSTEHPDCQYAKVTVYFHDIIDTDEGDNGFVVVPGTEFHVSRVGYTSNKSEYLVNGKKMTFTEVGKLLRKRGIDLDNNRFLILQGEVEQISLMKPKAQTPHEDGLLEYLEDIIGSNVYVDDIEDASKQVEKLSEERTEKLNRLKIVEKEKDGLEDSKTEAELFLRKEMELLSTRNMVCQLNAHEAKLNIDELDEKRAVLKEKHEYETEKLKKEQENLSSIENDFEAAQNQHQEIVAQLKAAKTRFSSFVRSEIKYKEDVKFSEKAINKLAKEVTKEEGSVKKFTKQKANLEAQIPEMESNIADAEQNKAHQAELLEELFQSFQGEAEEIRAEIEVKQKELAPFIQVTTQREGEVNVTTTEIQLIEDNVSKARAEQAKLTAQRDDMVAKIGSGPEDIKNMEKDLDQSKRRLGMVQAELKECIAREENTITTLRDSRSQLESVKASAQSQSSKGRMLNALLSAQKPGGALENCGLAGRLGDLGSIDKKYDVAISTACGALDYLVTDNTKGAERCVGYLRKQQLGRGTFIILDKVRHLEQQMARKVATPENAPRLFDLITPADDKFKVAFYYGVRNTLVAKDLEQAIRIAYEGNKCKWRVVTLQGQLIDTSGTMSGGGNKTKSGGMSSTLAQAAAKSGSASLDASEIKKMTESVEQLGALLKKLRASKADLTQEEKTLKRKIDKLEVSLSKLAMDLENMKTAVKQTEGRLAALDGKTELSDADQAKLDVLKEKLGKQTEALEEAKSNSSSLEQQVETLQQRILDLGGEKMKKQKQASKDAGEHLDNMNSALNKAISTIKSCERSIQKATEKTDKARGELKDKQDELDENQGKLDTINDGATEVESCFKDAEAEEAKQKQALGALKKEHETLKKKINKIEKVVVDIQNQLDIYDDEAESNRVKLSTWEKKLVTVKSKYVQLQKEVGSSSAEDEGDDTPAGTENNGSDGRDGENDNKDDDMDGEDEEVSPSRKISGARKAKRASTSEGEELPVFTTEELDDLVKDDLKVNISVLEEDIEKMKRNVNMGAIAEYRQREREYSERVGELDAATEVRDNARQVCETLRKKRLDEFMAGFSLITLKLKEMYQMITLGGDAELELVDSLDPFSEGIVFSVRPPKKSWKNISNLSGGEKTLSSLALVFALHHYKPTPLYVMDEIDAALDFKNVSIVANYIKERTKNAQFIIISLRNNMFELADRLVGIYKTNNATKSVTINPKLIVEQARKHQKTFASQQEGEPTSAVAREPLGEIN